MIPELIAFSSGVLLTIGGAYLTYLFQNRSEKSKKRNEIEFEVYMNLLNISTYYFWVTSSELTGENLDPEINKMIRDLSFKTSDLLRQYDDIKYLDEILEILFSEKYSTARERADEFSILLDKLHKQINPKFINKINVILTENRKLMANKPLSLYNAPGSSKI
jgi:hypothetical protein